MRSLKHTSIKIYMFLLLSVTSLILLEGFFYIHFLFAGIDRAFALLVWKWVGSWVFFSQNYFGSVQNVYFSLHGLSIIIVKTVVFFCVT